MSKNFRETLNRQVENVADFRGEYEALSPEYELAKMLIVTGYYSLSNVAELCGFRDYNHFSHTFKKLEGITPSGYKKQI